MVRSTKAKNGRTTARRSTGASKPRTQGSSRGRSSSARSTLPASTSGPELPRGWTFLTNHAHVLIVLYSEPELVLREVALRVGITERAVQRIVHELEEQGFLRREKVGRQNRYEVVTEKALRHSLESHRSIGDLISLIHG